MLASIESLYMSFFLAFFITDFVVSSIFLLEYVYRLKRTRDKKKFFLSLKRWIEFVSFAPFFLWLFFIPFMGWEILRVLRLFRILRVFDVTSESPLVQWFLRTIFRYKREYIWAFGIFFSCLIVFSSIVYSFEYQVNPWFENIFQSLWWGIVTMTTVWFWDVTPITLWGKIFGSFIVFLWPVLLALCSSITILVFRDVSDEKLASKEHKICRTCDTFNPKDANYCFHCGENLQNEKNSITPAEILGFHSFFKK